MLPQHLSYLPFPMRPRPQSSPLSRKLLNGKTHLHPNLPQSPRRTQLISKRSRIVATVVRVAIPPSTMVLGLRVPRLPATATSRLLSQRPQAQHLPALQAVISPISHPMQPASSSSAVSLRRLVHLGPSHQHLHSKCQAQET